MTPAIGSEAPRVSDSSDKFSKVSRKVLNYTEFILSKENQRHLKPIISERAVEKYEENEKNKFPAKQVNGENILKSNEENMSYNKVCRGKGAKGPDRADKENNNVSATDDSNVNSNTFVEATKSTTCKRKFGTAFEPNNNHTSFSKRQCNTQKMSSFISKPNLDEVFPLLYRQWAIFCEFSTVSDETNMELLRIAKDKRGKADETQADPTLKFGLYLKALLYYVMCARGLEQTNPEKASTYYEYSSSLMAHAIDKLVESKSQLCNGYLHVLGLQCSAIISQKVFCLKRRDLGNSYSTMKELFQKRKAGEGNNRSKSDIWKQIQRHQSITTLNENANKFWKEAEAMIGQSELKPFFANIDTDVSKLEISSDVLHLINYTMIVLAETETPRT